MGIPAREQDNHRKIIPPVVAVCLLSERPGHLPPERRRKGAPARGRTYERHVGRLVERLDWVQSADLEVVSGQWFSFKDANGHGCCQTDHYIVLQDHVLLLECKLTETWVGFSQIDFLYRPVLERIYSLPVTGVMVCRHLTTKSNPRLIWDLEEAVAAKGRNFVWHCVV